MIALALGCEIAPRSIFHRKNYFYPDLPKGYQISQYDIPLASSGELAVPGGAAGAHPPRAPRGGRGQADPPRRVGPHPRRRRSRSSTSTAAARRWSRSSPSRTCAPPADAREFLQLLRTTLKQIGVSDVNMEEGSLRCDANVSVREPGESGLRTKTELKNMNSFRFLERGIEAEIERQIAIWESGGDGRPGDAPLRSRRRGSLTSLRSKEEVHDYRYFPEPDLVPVAPTEEMLERARDGAARAAGRAARALSSPTTACRARRPRSS